MFTNAIKLASIYIYILCCKIYFLFLNGYLCGRGEWGEMAVGQNAQIDFVCYSIALAN